MQQQKVEIAVVGAGIAGLSVAGMLAAGGAEVLVLEARTAGGGWTGRDPGLARLGLSEHPQRTLEALGPGLARELFTFSAQGLDLLDDLGVLRRTGSLAAAWGPTEREADIGDGVEALQKLGFAAELWPAAKVGATLGASELGPGRLVPGDGLVDPAALIAALIRRLGGAHLREGARVLSLDEGPDGVTLHLERGSVLAELVVVAAGGACPALEPWFQSLVLPVRVQHVLLEGEAPPGPPTTVGHGSAWWRAGAAGGALFGGCRWALPDMEIGQTDDSIIDEEIDNTIRWMSGQIFPRLDGAPVVSRHSGVQGHTCDGLPLVGPLPGRSRIVALTGWNGMDLALAPRAARAVADGLLSGRAEGVPRCLSPSRMI